MNIQDEIERTWLLRYMPDIPDDQWADVIYIIQFYVKHEGKNCRLRYSYNSDLVGNKGTLRSRELIWKEKVGKGHNKEHHIPVTKGEATKLRKKATRAVQKVRWVYKGTDGFNYEIDNFESALLIKLEVEVPKLDQKIDIPAKIAETIICELTGVPGFDNFNIAETLTKETLSWIRV